MEPLIYKYGLLDPLDWGPDCAEQLYRNNRLWNNLVEIERAQRKRYLNLVDSQAEVFQMKASRDVLWEERKTLIKQRKKAVPLFWRVTIERFGIDMQAVQRQQGLTMMLGGHAMLAAAMGPDEDMAVPVMDKVTRTLCETCAVDHKQIIAVLAMSDA